MARADGSGASVAVDVVGSVVGAASVGASLEMLPPSVPTLGVVAPPHAARRKAVVTRPVARMPARWVVVMGAPDAWAGLSSAGPPR
jgi:hypothetical protein